MSLTHNRKEKREGEREDEDAVYKEDAVHAFAGYTGCKSKSRLIRVFFSISCVNERELTWVVCYAGLFLSLPSSLSPSLSFSLPLSLLDIEYKYKYAYK